MGINLDVFRLVRFEGSACVHPVLLRAGRPAYSDADQGAEDAADDFVDSALGHLQGWADRWWVRSVCRERHRTVLDGECGELVTGDDASVETLVDGPGFRWVDVWVVPTGQPGWLVLGGGDEVGFRRQLIEDHPPLAPAPAYPVRAFLITDRTGGLDISAPG